ncbi:glutathionyl-hydroquinone reductase YqjG-like isoform X2 [Ostrea edulis]|nr:glutathionyl-hydroquinone reductase YqjG-like isoform X2 [Ostrea edulis]
MDKGVKLEYVGTPGKSVIDKKGAFQRAQSAFRNWITADGSSGFKAESGRYHLYVSFACPWAHRTLIVRKLKGLEDVISVNVVDWLLNFETGWEFNEKRDASTSDTVNGKKFMKEVYKKADPDYNRSITVPVLWDKQKNTIVNNESSEIIRMLNSEFNAFCKTPEQKQLDLYPEDRRKEIDEVNEWIYPNINNGVYRSGFARSQEAYDEAVVALFEALDKVESILSKQRYLVGSCMTEADVRLFVTLVRFDKVYEQHFKCNKKRIIDYPNMWPYVRDIYQTEGIAETVNMEHIKNHYMVSHRSINPFGIVSIGPELDFNAPHDRNRTF